MRRVVVTGLGVVSPNATGLEDFERALREGRSGIRFHQQLQDLKFTCQVAGYPTVDPALIEANFTAEQRRNLNGVMTYGGLAAREAWRDAGLTATPDQTDWATGAIFGTGVGAADTVGDRLAPLTRDGQSRRMGSSVPEQAMCSNVSALIGGLFALGNRVSTNSSACATGTEAVVDCFRHIRSGLADRMIAGSSECDSPYVGSGFDAMRVTARKGNDRPEQASRPMSASATGFVPGAGAGSLILEDLESALARRARIYAEITGAAVTCGGQRNGGSITAPNPEGVRRCVRGAVEQAGKPDIGYINGHLTATGGDTKEIENLLEGLRLPAEKLPCVNSTKSMIGHTLGAAGSIECVATVLQLHRGFIHPSLNCEDVHPNLGAIASSIPHETRETRFQTALKTSFGFGDVNACVVFRAWNPN